MVGTIALPQPHSLSNDREERDDATEIRSAFKTFFCLKMERTLEKDHNLYARNIFGTQNWSMFGSNILHHIVCQRPVDIFSI